MTQGLPLAERKRRQARDRIVRAAAELFDERGFDAVSVAEIADRADVGRTTFFRHFGDKQEVVFAQEQELMATITTAQEASSTPVPSTVTDAVAELQDVVVRLCAQATLDPVAYTRHYALVARHPELRARDALKMQSFAERLADILTVRGADELTARFASQIALACYQTAKGRPGANPLSLVADTERMFEQALSLGRSDAA
jgi:AcrR family transcriptional regulator